MYSSEKKTWGSWFIGRTGAEAEAPILWPPDAKSRLIGKDPDAGKDWGQEKKVVREDEMVGWHHQLNGLVFEKTPEDGKGYRSLAFCSPWGCKESDTAERLNNSNIPIQNNRFLKIMELNKSTLFLNNFSFQCPSAFGILFKNIWYFSQNFQTPYGTLTGMLWPRIWLWVHVCGLAALVYSGSVVEMGGFKPHPRPN